MVSEAMDLWELTVQKKEENSDFASFQIYFSCLGIELRFRETPQASLFAVQ